MSHLKIPQFPVILHAIFGVAKTKYQQYNYSHYNDDAPGVWHEWDNQYLGVTYIYTVGYEHAFTKHHSLLLSYNYEVMNNLKIDYLATDYVTNYHGRLEETSLKMQYKFTF